MSFMRKIPVAVLLLIPMAGVLAQEDVLERCVVAMERQELECLKSGDYRQFAGLLAEDAVFVDSHGPAGKAEVVKNTSEFRLTDFSMDDIRFVALSANSGLLVYRLTESGVSHGKQFSARVYVSAVWAERDHKWMCLFSQETAAK